MSDVKDDKTDNVPFWRRYTDTDTDDPPEITRQLVQRVYREVWDEFFVWEQEAAQLALDEINQSIAFDLGQSTEESTLRVNPEDYIPDNYQNVSKRPYKDSFTVQTPTRLLRLKTDLIQAPNIDPFPVYESCTPSSISLAPRRCQPAQSDLLEFFPTIDGAQFSHSEYADLFKEFAWQGGVSENVLFRNPDVEEIQLETLKRLLNIPGATPQSIDQTAILRPSHTDDQGGILWLSHQRDGLWWSGVTTETPKYLQENPYPAIFQIQKSDVPGRVARSRRDFCGNRGCLVAFCRGHPVREDGQTTFLDSDIPPRKPTVSQEKLREKVKQPCGKYCFVHLPLSDDEDEDEDDGDKNVTIGQWTEEDVETLRALLTLSPDTLPCSLVWACRKRCDEIYLRRKEFDLDAAIVVTERERDEGDELRLIEAIIDSGKENLVFQPCKHYGPCGSRADCTCLRAAVYCQRDCSCTKNCIQRWKGCTCARKGKGSSREICRLWGYSSCPCVRARRECDPELCKGCCPKKLRRGFVQGGEDEDGDEASDPRCRNMQLQQGCHKQLIIKPAEFGAGAFIGEDARAGDLIGEYVGEFFPNSDSDRNIRDALYKARGRNYMFDIGGDILDAVSIANETRFPNHSAENTNCYARETNVNGQLRIGIFASKAIKEYEEVLFDYGDTFFNE